MRLMAYLALTTLTLALLLAPTGGAYAASQEDNTGRLSANQQIYAGYNNAAVQRVNEMVNRALEDEEKKRFKDKEERIDREIGQDIKGQQFKKAEPKLLRKSSQQNTSRSATDTNVVQNLIDSTNYVVKIGSGSNSTYDENGRLISEVIDGQRHVYVGFANAGKSKIVDGIKQAKKEGGGIVIVKAGTYNESYIYMANGVSLYGGYNELGQRDVNKYTTTVNGLFTGSNITKRTELNGFTIRGNYNAITIYGNTAGWIILNNTMRATMCISSYGNATVYNNLFSNSTWAVHSWSSYYGPLKFINNIVRNTNWGFTDAYGSKSIVENNLFYNNSAAIISHTGATVIRNNTFTSTTGSGIGVRYFSSAPVVENNIFYNLKTAFSIETWAATGARGPSTFNLKNNVFYNNASFGISAASLATGVNVGSVFNVNPGIDPTKGIYASILTDKGYSAGNVNTTYSKFLLGNTATKSLANSGLGTKYVYNLGSNYYSPYTTGNLMFNSNVRDMSTVIKRLILNKNILTQNLSGKADPAGVKKIVRDSLKQSALSIPRGQVDPRAMELAMRLAGIMKDPTPDQQTILTSLSGLINDVSQVEQETGQSSDLTNDQNKLIQMVADVLLTQGTKGFATKKEASYIMNLFRELDAQKASIMQSYNDATETYFKLLKRDMIKNMAALQSSGVLSKNTLDELERTSRSKMQEIIEKLKKLSSEKKGFAEGDYIVQREAYYKEKYFDPPRKELEAKMREMMNGFTGRLQEALEAKNK